jgi:thioredoxin-related protein/YHS domain-containing protein
VEIDMRVFTRILAAASSMLLAAASTWGADAVRWESDFETAMQKAAQQNRLVLVHFWNDGCPPCKEVDRTVFPDPQVAQAIHASYVPVKVHAGQRADLAQKLGVRAWPTDVILTPRGDKLGQYVSPQQPSQYVQMVQQVAAREPSRGVNTAGGLAQTSGQAAPGTNNHASAYAPQNGVAAAANYAQAAGGEFPLQRPSGLGQPQTPQNDIASTFRPGGNALQQPYPPQQASMQPSYANPYAGPSPYANNNTPPRSEPGRDSTYAGGAFQPSALAPPMNSPYGGVPATPGGALGQARPNAPAATLGAPSANGPGMNAPPFGHSSPFAGQAPHGAPPVHPGQPPMGHVPPGHVGMAPQAVPQAPQFELDGYCVVSLVEQLHLPLEQQRWKKGDARWGAVHRNKTYLFAGPGEQQRFLANPDYYAPILDGHDPVVFLEHGQHVRGRREHGFTHEGKIYMFANEANLQKFWGQRDMYVARVQQAMAADPMLRR